MHLRVMALKLLLAKLQPLLQPIVVAVVAAELVATAVLQVDLVASFFVTLTQILLLLQLLEAQLSL
jgi:hypothetical protein